MKAKINNFLDEIREEQEDIEKVGLNKNTDPVRRIARVLDIIKPKYNFQEIVGNNIPYVALAYYLSDDLDAKKTNYFLDKGEEDAFLRIIGVDKNKKEKSLISKIMGEDSKLESLRLFLYYQRNRKNFEGLRLNEEPLVFQYTTPQFLPYIAAQKLVELFPNLKDNAHRISNKKDLSDLIFYSNISQGANNCNLRRNDGLQKGVMNTLVEYFADYSYFFEFQNALNYYLLKRKEFFYNLIDWSKLNFLTKDKRELRGLCMQVLENAFGEHLKQYEKVACLAELVDKPKDIKRLFSRRKIFETFIESNVLLKEEMNFAKMWKKVVGLFYRNEGYNFDGRYFYRDVKPGDVPNKNRFRLKTNSILWRTLYKISGIERNLGQTLQSYENLGELTNILEVVLPAPHCKKLNYQGYKTLCLELQLNLNEEQIRSFENAKYSAERSYKFIEPLKDENLEKQREINTILLERFKSIWG